MDAQYSPRRHHSKAVSLITAPEHDLRGTGRYFLTMVTSPRRHVLSEIQAGGTAVWTPMGQCVHRHLEKMVSLYPIAIDRQAIMPDHIHVCFRVTAPLRRSILQVLATLRKLSEKDACALEGATTTLWEEKYRLFTAFDRAIYTRCIEYTAANPKRWWLTRQHAINLRPRPITHANLPAIYPWQAVGNLSLLEVPLKYAVVIHRSDSPEVVAEKTAMACKIAEMGGVIVGGFIAQAEKTLLKTLYQCVPNLRLISLMPHTLTGYKPPARALDDFKEGRRLLLSSVPNHPVDQPCLRAVCLRHNALAEALAASFLTSGDTPEGIR